MKTFLLFCFCILTFFLLYAQCEDPQETQRIIAQIKMDLSKNEYHHLISRLLKVRDECPEYKNEVNNLLDQIIMRIEEEQKEADSIRLAVERLQYQMFFYRDKFGLTLKNVAYLYETPRFRYGYIDRQGRETIPFEFEEAKPFSYLDGFARVSIKQQKYLLDTNGQRYRLAESLDELNMQTEALDLHENIPDFLPEDLGKYTGLKILLLYHGVLLLQHGNMVVEQGPLKQLPESISNLKSLQHLDLRSNQFQSLPDFFGQLVELQILDLSYNELNSLPTSFGQLTQVRNLNLYKNQLISLPKSFGQLSKLQELELGKNPWQSFPESVSNLTGVQYLDFSYQEWEKVPEGLEYFVHLKKLSLSFNKLSSLPRNLGQMAHLQSLDVAANRLSYLPESIGQLQQLKFLDLSLNQLNSLPETFGQLIQLQNLHLAYNQLYELPESFLHLNQLKILDLDGNQFKTLPKMITRLTQLHYLGVGYNQLKKLPDGIGELHNLETLYLRSNQLLSLPDEICMREVLKVSQWGGFALQNNPLSHLPACYLDKHNEQELVDFADYCLAASLYHVALQTLENLGRRFPDRLKEEQKQLFELVKKLEIASPKDTDLQTIGKMLEQIGE